MKSIFVHGCLWLFFLFSFSALAEVVEDQRPDECAVEWSDFLITGCTSSADCPWASMCDPSGICVNPDGSGASECNTSADCPGRALCDVHGKCYIP